jgi:hypothetical protein
MSENLTEAQQEQDPMEPFRKEVALYLKHDPYPTLGRLSEATGVPVPDLITYVLVKYAASAAEATMLMEPIFISQLKEVVEKFDEAVAPDGKTLHTADPALKLRNMIQWLLLET